MGKAQGTNLKEGLKEIENKILAEKLEFLALFESSVKKK